MTYRVVYGETMPAWEKDFPTLAEAKNFANGQRRCGDIVFFTGVAHKAPRSLMRALEDDRQHRDGTV